MKILCLSDLHLRMNDAIDVMHQQHFTPFLQNIRELVEDTKPDVAQTPPKTRTLKGWRDDISESDGHAIPPPEKANRFVLSATQSH
ncbi:MAG: hypothetical protein II943_02955 [Victivallales bacterium]|nr:hypothetical protein [Victivallales bacterium]